MYLNSTFVNDYNNEANEQNIIIHLHMATNNVINVVNKYFWPLIYSRLMLVILKSEKNYSS